MKRAALGLAAAAAALTIITGCAGDNRVSRVYSGRIVEGTFVPPEAYAAYLKGVLAEEAGDLRSALAAYEVAAREDDEDPEPLTRVGDVQCKLDPKNGRAADDAFARALKIDATYAPALAAKARCAGLRGHPAEGVALLDRVAVEDRSAPSMEAAFVRLAAQRADASGSDAKARERAIALTLASGEYPAAWDALIAWGRAKADDELLARGFEGLVRVAPMRSAESEAGALELLGLGRLTLARRVAATIADLGAEYGVRGIQDPTVARLAIDEALANDAPSQTLVERRAVRGHVPLAEVAARAMLMERPELARTIAKNVTSADPTSGCASMVLVALTDKGLRLGKEAPTDRPAAACVLALADRIATYGNSDIARTWVGRMNPAPITPHDPIAGALAVDLAARGVLTPNSLPLELRVELAARRREPPPPVDIAAIDQHVVDQKHALLWHVLIDPTGAPAKNLLSRMYNASDRDPIVGFALARTALASGAIASKPEVLRALAAAPAHPLLLAVAVDIAKKGRAEDVPPARARLMAVARTPAERALAVER